MLNLAEFFRYSLQTPEKLISLSEEMAIVRAYLEIEKLRLGPRLQIAIDIDDAAKDVKIPVLSVQPLVEKCNQAWCCREREAGLGENHG